MKYNLWELKKHELYSSGWWCNFTILKNHGVKVNGVGMIHSYEMEVIIQLCLKPPTRYIVVPIIN